MSVEPLARSPSHWAHADLVAQAVPSDEREWVPAALPGVWMRPLLFDTGTGAWINLVRMRTEGLISRHAHPAPVQGYVIAGRWRYAERDWVAEQGMFIHEPAGDIHSLIAMPGESLTLFWIHGNLVELDEGGRTIGYADVFTRIEQARHHYAECGLGADYVRKFIR